MLPYQMLLHRKTREQLDISIKESVIIIDEAHNLLDTISNIHSAELNFGQLQRAHQHLCAYKEKYFARFSTKSLLRLNQLISIANRLIKRMTSKQNTAGDAWSKTQSTSDFSSEMIFVHEFLDDANISTFTLYEIMKFCDETRLAQKLQGFVKRYGNEIVTNADKEVKPKQTHTDYLKRLSEQKINESKSKKSAKNANESGAANVVVEQEGEKDKDLFNENATSASVIRLLLNFMECLLEKSTDGRILLSFNKLQQSKSSIKYLLLNPSAPFEEFLRECRAVHRTKIRKIECF